MLRVLSANVNGIRAAVRRGGMDWMVAQRPDVLCLQEVRASDDQLAEALDAGGLGGWHVAHTEAADKGRAGVAVITRDQPVAVRYGLGHPEFEGTGRWVEVDLPTPSGLLTVISTYVHTGEAGTARQDLKYRFLDAVAGRMATLRRAADQGAHAVVTGDLNVAHREADLKNWKGNLTKSGFLPDERAYLDRWLGDGGGWVDVHRSFAGVGPGPYTWWSWRGQAFDNDTGWRIDYQLATQLLADRVLAASAGRAATYAERWSDHAAVVVDYDL
jgi:exodeoxyribonuclease-3